MTSQQSTIVEFPCDALIFDLDGVLIDTIPVIIRQWRRWAISRGLDPDDVLRQSHGRRTAETIRVVAPHLDSEAEAIALDDAQIDDAEGPLKVEGAGRLIGSIPANAWAVATSGPRRMADSRLAFTGLPLPPVLITGEDVTIGKPDPEPFLRAAAGLGVAPERCVVIEDAPAGIQAARNGRMHVIAVASSHTLAELAHADVIAACLADIEVIPGQPGAGRCLVRVKSV